jgi:hypothetical protein
MKLRLMNSPNGSSVLQALARVVTFQFGLQRWSEGRGNGCNLRGKHTAAGGGSADIDKRQLNKAKAQTGATSATGQSSREGCNAATCQKISFKKLAE